MQPTKGDVHVNRPLTQISIGYFQQASDFVATQVFPNVPVLKQSDSYFVYDRGDFFRDEMQKRAPGTESAGGSYDIDHSSTYNCYVWSVHKDVPDQIRANADDPLNLDREATLYVSHKAMIRRERVWASSYFTTSVWTTDVTGVASGPSGAQVLHWSDDASTPIEDIRLYKRTVKELTGFFPNKLVLGRATYDYLCDHPDIIDRIKYGQTSGSPAMVNRQTLAALFELDQILVMDAVYNTAVEGGTDSFSFVGGKHALLAYAAPSPGLMTPSAGYTFSWTGYLAAGNAGQRIKQFRLEREEVDRIEINLAFDMGVVGADLGVFFNGVVA